jgi:cyclohexyl-isocyanide hydratase
VLGWIREQAARVRCLFSVCTGALICGAAGLLSAPARLSDFLTAHEQVAKR